MAARETAGEDDALVVLENALGLKVEATSSWLQVTHLRYSTTDIHASYHV